MAVSFGFINPFSKTVLNNTSLSLLEAMIYVNFPWSPVVAAHDRERFSRGQNSRGNSLALERLTLHSEFGYALQILPFPISNQNLVSCDNKTCCSTSTIACFSPCQLHVISSRQCSLGKVNVAVTEIHRQPVENDRLITQSTFYR